MQSIYNNFNDLKKVWETIDKGKITSQNEVMQNRDNNIYENMKNYDTLAGIVKQLDNTTNLVNLWIGKGATAFYNNFDKYKNKMDEWALDFKEHAKNTKNLLSNLINIANPVNLTKRTLSEVKNIRKNN